MNNSDQKHKYEEPIFDLVKEQKQKTVSFHQNSKDQLEDDHDYN